MQPRTLFALLIQLLILCLVQADELSDSLSYVTRECKSKLLSINSLNGFKEFMKHYRSVVGSTDKPKKGILNSDKGLRKCFDQKEKLFELEALILHQDDGVCRLNYISKLVDYHLDHVIKGKESSEDEPASPTKKKNVTRKTYAAYIFSLYAHQVTFTCKSKLLERVTVLESRLGFADILGTFLPDDLLRSDLSKDDARSKLDTFLSNFKQVEDFSLMFAKTTPINPYYNLPLSSQAGSKIEKIKNLKELCKAREPYYNALLLPVSTLSQLGYDVTGTSMDSYDLNSRDSAVLKCWLATAQLCQGMLRVHIEVTDNEKSSDQADTDGKFFEIKFDQAPADVVELGSETTLPDEFKFEDFISELSPEIIQLVDKKKSLVSRFKRSFNWTKKFILKHAKIDASQNKMARQFVAALIRDEDEEDKGVGYNGDQYVGKGIGIWSWMKMLANDADTVLIAASFFVSHKVSLILNSCFAIVFSLVLVIFTFFATAFKFKTTIAAPEYEGYQDNFKGLFKKILDDRMNSVDKAVDKDTLAEKIGGKVYVGTHPS